MNEIGHSRPDVCVVDDDDAVLDAIRLRLQGERISGRYFASAEALLTALASGVRPMCIVSDVMLPGLSGLDLQDRLKSLDASIPLILITGHGEVPMAVRALKAGAFDFLEKPFDSARLIQAIQAAVEQASKEIGLGANLADLRGRVTQLSERQREVMDLAVLGFSNKEIAQKLDLSPRTVESYRVHVMEKTGAANLAELVRIAMQLELTHLRTP